jgi:hypothetical protein
MGFNLVFKGGKLINCKTTRIIENFKQIVLCVCKVLGSNLDTYNLPYEALTVLDPRC